MKKILILLMAFAFLGCSNEKEVIEDKKPNILIVGNSIVLFPERNEIGWNHNHGMAATSEDTDFYGVIRNTVPHNHIERFNLWAWEGSWDYISIGRKTQPCDILIVKVGENVADIPNFKRELNNLVNFYKDNNTKVIIVSTAIGGLLHPTDAMMEEFCGERGYTFVDLRAMQQDVTNFAWDEWEDGAIGCHPSDKGMQFIADEIIEKL